MMEGTAIAGDTKLNGEFRRSEVSQPTEITHTHDEDDESDESQ